MIKSITKLLNSRIVLQKQFARFTAGKDVEDDAPIDPQLVEMGKQQLEAALPQGQAVEAVEGAQIEAGQEAVDTAYVDEDPFQGVNLLQSNWKDIASLINTTYYHNNQDPRLHKEVKNKLRQIESLYGLDLNNLNRVKILEQREFEIRSNINAIAWQSNRYLQNDIAETSRIGYSMMTGKKFRELLDTNNLQAIKQLYRNNEFQTFVLQADLGIKIIDLVVGNNYQNHFMLNLLECLKSIEKDKLLKPTKNFQKIIQNIHQLEEVNKLKFFWRVNSAVEGGQQFVRHSIINHELAKIKFEGFDDLVCEKALRNAYSAVLGNNVMKKLINYSLEKFSASFNQFIQFWGLFNLLITRLISLNEASITNPHNLNSIFNLFELNLEEPKDILTQIIPEILFETKSKMLFEIYRVHAKYWIERKTDPKLTINVGPFDQFLNTKIDLEESIQVTYNPWPAENYFPTRSLIRTSKKASRQLERADQILSETKMLEHLIKGDYSFVLNHFLLVFNPGLEKDSFNELRKIIQEAKDQQFSDENAKALYILRKINERFFYQSEPVAFRQEFLTDYKKIKWLERKEGEPPKIRKPYMQKMWEQDEGKYSRKRVDRADSEEHIDNKERIYTKAQRKQGGALFSKKNKTLFSTQKDSYTEYRQVVKDLTPQQNPPAEFGFSLSMDRFTDLNTFKQEVEARSKQMNEINHKALFNTHNLPIVGSGANLMKYLFLKKPEGEAPKIDEQLRRKLRVSFVSQIGALEKDFSQYLQGCRFTFPLAEEVYTALLEDQKTNYVRKSFKTIVSHMIAYKKQLSDTQVQLICDICKKYRIGITLIEIYNLMIENKIQVSREAIYVLCDSLQKFRKINGDIFLMTKKYCENIGLPFEVTMMSSYVKSLLIQEEDQKLAELCDILKTELRPKPYKLRPDLSAEQNIKLQKEYKDYQRKQSHRVLNEIINVVVMNVNNKLPVFVSQLFDEFEKTQTKLEAKEIAISLIVYCNDVEKFLSILRSLKTEPEKIILTTFECAIKALRLNNRGLEGHSEEIFNTTLFTHNFMLNEELITKSVQIFKSLTTPTVFIKFLEYLLRHNPALNYEIKNSMYFVMNSINDDFAKNTISGLLDFIFNSNRQKERDQYRKAQITEETKVKLLQDLEKKDFFFDKTDNQKERIIDDIEHGKLDEARQPKKNKSLEKQRVDKRLKEQQKNKVQNPGSAKTEKRRITTKGEQSLVPQGDGILRKSTVKKKLRNKSLNDFEQMFTQREEVIEEEKPVKGAKGAKGAKQPAPKDLKKKGK